MGGLILAGEWAIDRQPIGASFEVVEQAIDEVRDGRWPYVSDRLCQTCQAAVVTLNRYPEVLSPRLGRLMFHQLTTAS